MFKYKMVQIPPNIAVEMKKHKGNEAAAYLEEVVNKYASQGWEFHRIALLKGSTPINDAASLLVK